MPTYEDFNYLLSAIGDYDRDANRDVVTFTFRDGAEILVAFPYSTSVTDEEVIDQAFLHPDVQAKLAEMRKEAG